MARAGTITRRNSSGDLVIAGARDAEGRILEAAYLCEVEQGEHVLRLGPGRTLHGRILRPSGVPLPDVPVVAYPFDHRAPWNHAPPPALNPEFPEQTSARTDEDGRFTLDGLGRFPYSLLLEVSRDFLDPSPVDVSDEQTDLLIRLRPAVTAAITVLDDRGRPAPGAKILLRFVGLRFRSAVAGADGTGIVDGLDPYETYTLEADSDRPDVVRRALRKLEQLNAATVLRDLRVPSSNRLHALSGSRAGQHSISVNDQWRNCFVFTDGDVFDVEFCDYH